MAEYENKRSQRVAQLIAQELSLLLIHGLKDPRVGFVTITQVRLTDDLKSAHVFVSILGEEADRKSCLAGLTAATGFLRRELGQRLKLRYMPQMQFIHDDSLDKVQRLDMLFAATHNDEGLLTFKDIAPLPKAETNRMPSAKELDALLPKATIKPKKSRTTKLKKKR